MIAAAPVGRAGLVPADFVETDFAEAPCDDAAADLARPAGLALDLAPADLAAFAGAAVFAGLPDLLLAGLATAAEAVARVLAAVFSFVLTFVLTEVFEELPAALPALRVGRFLVLEAVGIDQLPYRKPAESSRKQP